MGEQVPTTTKSDPYSWVLPKEPKEAISQITQQPSPPPVSPLPASPPPPLRLEMPSKEISPKNLPLKKILFGTAILALLLGIVLLVLTFWRGKNFGLGGQVTLTYWGLFEPPSVFQQVIADYEKSHPKVKILYQQSNLREYRERLQKALENNTAPDIFRFHQSWVPMLGRYLSPIPATVFDPASFEKTFFPSAKESLSFKGQYVGIPLMYDGLALFYNEDLFRAAGKTPPQNWEQLRTTAIELTVRDQQGKIQTAGVALGAPNVDHWSDILGLMLLQSGVDPASPAVCGGSSEAGGGNICPGADALSYFTLFTRTDRVWDATLPSSTFAFATGNLAMYFGPSWRVFDIEELKKNYRTDFNYKIIPVPQLPEGNVSWASYWAEGVAKSSTHQTEAWKFLAYLSSKEILQKLYQTESALRPFGEPYPRADMVDLLKSQPLIGAYIQQAPFAKNWYLSSSTNDNGLNQQIIKYYEDAVNLVNSGGEAVSALQTATLGINQVLKQYGVK